MEVRNSQLKMGQFDKQKFQITAFNIWITRNLDLFIYLKRNGKPDDLTSAARLLVTTLR